MGPALSTKISARGANTSTMRLQKMPSFFQAVPLTRLQVRTIKGLVHQIAWLPQLLRLQLLQPQLPQQLGYYNLNYYNLNNYNLNVINLEGPVSPVVWCQQLHTTSVVHLS